MDPRTISIIGAAIAVSIGSIGPALAEGRSVAAAMDSAHDNVTKKLAELHQSAQQARRTGITSELLDVITGAEAVSGQTSRRG